MVEEFNLSEKKSGDHEPYILTSWEVKEFIKLLRVFMDENLICDNTYLLGLVNKWFEDHAGDKLI